MGGVHADFRPIVATSGENGLSYAHGREDGCVSEIEVRVATADDLPAVAEFRWVEDSESPQPAMAHDAFVTEFVAWVLAHPGYHGVIALDGVQVVGMAWLAAVPRIPSALRFDRAGGDVQSFFVLPEYRDSGLGTAILRRLVDLARELGLTRVTVQSSRRAIPLYNRAGFELKPFLLALDLT
jgi:GNAT superfamily N-acetyltransferase